MDQKPSKNKEESAERTNSAKLVDNIMFFIATVCFAVGGFILMLSLCNLIYKTINSLRVLFDL